VRLLLLYLKGRDARAVGVRGNTSVSDEAKLLWTTFPLFILRLRPQFCAVLLKNVKNP
jgi:hypothetical protein